MNARLEFFLLNAVGGAAVLGSYAWGLLGYPELREAFWGDVPAAWRPWYSVNMVLAAAGYLLVFASLLRDAGPARLRTLRLPYVLILLPSALWLPLTVWLLDGGQAALWLLIRADLFAVAAGGLWLWIALWREPGGRGGLLGRLARVAFGFFVLQTAVLDALLWPAWFPLPG